MSRPIEFRAWDTVDEIMIDWSCICQTAWNCQSIHQQKQATMQFEPLIYRLLMNHADRYILEQYTGLRDSKRTEGFPEGQKIWEGDVVRSSNKKYLYRIFWQPEFARYCLHLLGYQGEQNIGIIDIDVFTSEVIGNIHQNPELLKAKE